MKTDSGIRDRGHKPWWSTSPRNGHTMRQDDKNNDAII